MIGLPFLTRTARAQSHMPVIRIGVLWDRSGVGSVTSGLDQVVAARLAIEDFGQLSRGYQVELLDSEFERRPGQAVDQATRWFDADHAAAILDIPGTAAPVQVQALARARNRTVMNTGSFNAALTGAACSPTATHWLEDTRALTRAMTLGMAAEGVKAWFLVVPDDPAGLAFQADATAAIESTGGHVLAFTQHPAESALSSRAIANARESGADAVGLCAIGTALEAQIREARASGLFDRVRAVCAYGAGIKDIHAMGPVLARDLRITAGFYWNTNAQTRSFARRFQAYTTRMPDRSHAATYAAIEHLLRTIETTDTIDGTALNVTMRQQDPYFFGLPARVRFDGRFMLDVQLYRVKAPDQVIEDWDYYQPVRSLTARNVFLPAPNGVCKPPG